MQTASLGGQIIDEGDWMCLNGDTGEVIKGKQPLKRASICGDLAAFMEWVDEARRLGVQVGRWIDPDGQRVPLLTPAFPNGLTEAGEFRACVPA
jgi:hypothetical protein